MPTRPDVPGGLKYGVAAIFVLGLGFGAAVALNQEDPKPKPKPQTVVQAKTTQPTAVAPKSEPKPQPKPEPVKTIIDEPKPKPEPMKVEPKPEPMKVVEPKPEITPPEPKPVVKPEPKPEPNSEPKKPEPKPEPTTTAAASVTFDDVKGILQSKCVSCHGDPVVKARIDVRSIASMKGKAGLLVPGKPDTSDLWGAIESGSMPPPDKSQLTEAQKMKIKAWILAGAK